jgi:ribonucleoside-diphosphate reductase alpha chain
MDGLTLAISQGSLRRGSAAVYLDVHHPEIEEFLEIRKASGDFNRKGLNLHHGINITDAFMQAVKNDAMFPLRSPKTNEVLREVNARQLWQRILETRLQTGSPICCSSIRSTNAQTPARVGSPTSILQRNTLPTGTDHPQDHGGVLFVVLNVDREQWCDGRVSEIRFLESTDLSQQPGRNETGSLRRPARAFCRPGIMAFTRFQAK